jgi:hypothetical protein
MEILRERADEVMQPGGASLDEIDELRQIVRDVAKTPNEFRLAGRAREVFDDWADVLQPSDVIAGDKRALTEILPRARTLWRRHKKTELLEDVIERAEDVAGGPTKLVTSYKARFRALKNHKDFERTFNAEERAAISRVIRADGAEQFAQSLTSLTSMMGLGAAGIGAGALLGTATGGAGTAAAAAAIGALRYGLGRGARHRAEDAAHLVATGSPLRRPENLFAPAAGVGLGVGGGTLGGGGGF